MSQSIFRFAPSPNGLLHLGHAFSALYTDSFAKQLGATFLLRIEDIDIARCKPEFTAAIFEDLTWLGLRWQTPVWHQSQRFDAYQRAATQLADLGLTYPCFCSRTDIAAHATQKDPDGAPIYPGTCRHLSSAEIADRKAEGQLFALRLHMRKALDRTGMLTFTRVRPGHDDRPQIRHARPERWGDAIIVRKDVPTSYHLACVVDDAAQNITHVTRGRDMEAATDLHVLLQFLLGLPSPAYGFHPLIEESKGQKLAKSKGSPSLRSLREAGESAQAIRERLGF